MDEPSVILAGRAGVVPLSDWCANRIVAELDRATAELPQLLLLKLLLRISANVEARAMQLPSEMTDG